MFQNKPILCWFLLSKVLINELITGIDTIYQEGNEKLIFCVIQMCVSSFLMTVVLIFYKTVTVLVNPFSVFLLISFSFLHTFHSLFFCCVTLLLFVSKL